MNSSTFSPTDSRRPTAVVAVVAALIVAMIAGLLAVASPASASTGVHNRTKAEKAMGYALLKMLNHERRAHHLAPLVLNTDLMTSARRHDVTMARFNEMDHQLPGEAIFYRRISSAGYKWSWAGENIAWNSRMSTSGVLQLESMMYHEKAPYNGHRLNILSRDFRNVGVDVYLDTVHHKVWLTTDFGRRL